MASIYPFLSVALGKNKGFYILTRDQDRNDPLSQPSGLIYHVSELNYQLCVDPLSVVKDLKPQMGMTLTTDGNPVLSYCPEIVNADINKGVQLFKKYPVSTLVDFLPRASLELVVIHSVVQSGKMSLTEATNTVSLHIDQQIKMDQLKALESLGYNPAKLIGSSSDKVSSTVTIDTSVEVMEEESTTDDMDLILEDAYNRHGQSEPSEETITLDDLAAALNTGKPKPANSRSKVTTK